MKENILFYPFTIFHVQEQRPLIGMHESHVRFGWITSERLTQNESETYQSYSFVWVLNIKTLEFGFFFFFFFHKCPFYFLTNYKGFFIIFFFFWLKVP